MSRQSLDAAALRAEFDAAFARAPREGRTRGLALVLVEAGGAPVALPMERLAGLHAGRRVVPVPGAPAALRGLVGVGGRAWAAFDLGLLLGQPPTAAAPRWVALLQGGAGLALAFDRFERYAEAPPDALRALEPGAARPHVTRLAQLEGRPWPLLDVPSLLSTVVPTGPA